MRLHINRKYKLIPNIFIFLLSSFDVPLFAQDDFTIIGLPDTQYYTENLQGSGVGQGTGDIATFHAQTNWIVNNRIAENIVYVAHLGDCVQNGDDVEAEWIRAEDAMDNLEDPVTTLLADGIPYGMAVGNHDQSPFGDPGIGSSTTQLYNQYFGVSRFSGRDYYGNHYGSDNDNHFDTITVSGMKLIFVYIEYGAYRDDKPAVDWADSILSAFSDRHAIVVSHKLLDDLSGPNATFSTAGEYIYAKLRDNPNLFLMLAGHWTNEASRTETRGGDSSDVVTLMSDYQGLANGGDGWMRIMRFSPTDGKIYVSTYSPTLDQFKTGSDSQFEINYGFPSLPLPVELAFFTGSVNGNSIDLWWRTETEINNYGFDIERSVNSSGWEAIGFIEGNGNSNSPKNYNFTDYEIDQSGNYSYRLKQIDNDGSIDYSNNITINVETPNNIYLSQNYPNPFNPSTRIDYSIPEDQFVSIRVYDILGELVSELVNEVKAAGSYSVNFDASNLAGGIYTYRLQTNGFIISRKMILLR